MLVKNRTYNKFALLCYQKNLIEKNYDFLSCRIENRGIGKVLICTGWIRPEDCKEDYKIMIEYVSGHEPRTTILYPIIDGSVKIHMYKDHSLCLHYPKDMKWSEQIKIFQYTIPWVCEWIIFYELFLVNGGKWEGRESPSHITENDKNLNSDPD